jgi:transcriptional regulator with XRE-family HTH domain
MANSGCTVGTFTLEGSVPRKKSVKPDQSFGARLASLRHAAGLSQSQFGKQTGVSQRMIAYYEGRAALPPGHVLTVFAEALGVSVDELVGKKPPRAAHPSPRRTHPRLWQRFSQIEKLPLRDRKELFNVIDAYLERHRLVQKAS